MKLKLFTKSTVDKAKSLKGSWNGTVESMNSTKNKLNSKKKLVFYANAKHTLELVTTLGFMVKMLWT